MAIYYQTTEIAQHCNQDIKLFRKSNPSMFCSFPLEIDTIEAIDQITTLAVAADVHHSRRCAAEVVGRIAALLHIGCVGVDRSSGVHRTAHCGHIDPGEAAAAAAHRPGRHTQLGVHTLALRPLRSRLDLSEHRRVGCGLQMTAGAVDPALEIHSSGLEEGSFGVAHRIHLVDAVDFAGADHNQSADVDRDCHTGLELGMNTNCGLGSMHAIRWAGTT